MTSDGIEVRFETLGAGPVVYLCHGGPSNVCDTLVADLAPLGDSFTLVFHDYRGSGRSAAAPATTYRFERLADDVDEPRQYLGHKSVSVVAHSMGGFVALQYALRHADRCNRLALVGTTPCGNAKTMAIPVLRALGFLRTVKALLMGIRFAALWSWRSPSLRRTRAMYAVAAVTQEAKPELRGQVSAAHPELPVDNDNAPHLLKALRDLDLRADLARVTCPVLIAYGSRDAASVVGGQMLAAGVQQGVVRVLDDVGHEPFVEAPGPTFSVLQGFLDG